MSTVTEDPRGKESAAAEADAHHREYELERARGRVLTLSVILAALAALAAGLVALDLNGGIGGTTKVVASHTPNGTAGQMNGASASNMPGKMGAMSGAGQSGKGMGASSATVVSSTLGEYYVRPSVSSVPAGKVTFTAKNVGQVTHELMIERAPIKMDGPMQPNEDAAQGMIADMAPGESGKMTLDLKPGMYQLFCNVTGHYAAGQYTMFRVTG